MFIICVGVGFFGGLNTFAFMAAEVSRRAIVGSPVAPQYFVRHFWIIISRWYFDCTSSVIIDSKREFFLWEIPTHDSSHSSHLHFQFKCIQHKNVNKICISVPLGRMERWRCADETQEKERKLVISVVATCNILCYIQQQNPMLESKEKYSWPEYRATLSFYLQIASVGK